MTQIVEADRPQSCSFRIINKFCGIPDFLPSVQPTIPSHGISLRMSESWHMRRSGNQNVMFNMFIGFVIHSFVLGNIAQERHKQCRRIALLDEIPEMKQPCSTAISIKIGMVICKCKVQDFLMKTGRSHR